VVDPRTPGAIDCLSMWSDDGKGLVRIGQHVMQNCQ
jgi:hypothetical protein